MNTERRTALKKQATSKRGRSLALTIGGAALLVAGGTLAYFLLKGRQSGGVIPLGALLTPQTALLSLTVSTDESPWRQLGEFGDFGFGEPGANLEIAAILSGHEIQDFALDDLEAVAMKIKIGDHFGIEQRDSIGCRRVAETGMKFFGDRSATHHVTLFQNGHLVARLCQIEGADQPVMPSPNDDDFAHAQTPIVPGFSGEARPMERPGW